MNSYKLYDLPGNADMKQTWKMKYEIVAMKQQWKDKTKN